MTAQLIVNFTKRFENKKRNKKNGNNYKHIRKQIIYEKFYFE